MAKLTLDRETFKALASETRLDVLRALDERRKTGTEIARELELNKATVHEHLGVLAAVGLVKKIDEGRKWIYYELSWEGQKLLHPESGATFSVLLGLSALAGIGGMANAVRLLVARFAPVDSDGGVVEESVPPQAPEEQGDTAATSPDSNNDGNSSNDMEHAFLRDAEDGSVQADTDGGWLDDGGMFMIVFLALSILFLVLAYVIRRRRS